MSSKHVAVVGATGAGFVYSTSEELRKSLALLADDSNLRETLSRRARDGYLNLYTPQRHLAGYLDHVQAIRNAKGLH